MMLRALALGLALMLAATAAWGQEHRPPNSAFRVSWERRTSGAPSTIGGRVYNDSAYRVTNVRLRVEGLDGDNQPMGQKFTWALGDIAPGGETTFVVESLPGAVTYRIAVDSFHLVSRGPTP